MEKTGIMIEIIKIYGHTPGKKISIQILIFRFFLEHRSSNFYFRVTGLTSVNTP